MTKVSINDPTLPPEQIAAWADRFAQAGLTSSWSDSPVRAEAQAAGCDYGDFTAIGAELWRRKVRAACEVFDTTPAIKAYLLEHCGDRGCREPVRHDLSGLARAAKQTRNQYGKTRPPLHASDDCPLTMKLSETVSFAYRQEAYADHSCYLVPVTGTPPADLSACQRRLGEFFRRCDTHTGLAGSGCNWSAHLEVRPEGAFVVVDCRASISD